MWHSGLDLDHGQEEDLGRGLGGDHGPGHTIALGQEPERVVVVELVVVVVVVEGATLGQYLVLTIERELGEGVTPLPPPPPIPRLVLARPPVHPPVLGHEEGAETSGGGGAVADPVHPSKRSLRRRKLHLPPRPQKRSL